MCCVAIGLPGALGNIGATGHTQRTIDSGFSESETLSTAVERPGQTERRESRRGMGTYIHITQLLLCLTITGSMGHMSELGLPRGQF